MTLTIVRESNEGGGMRSDRRLYLTRDRTRVVEEGDPDAGFLFAVPGREISIADAERYGLSVKDGRIKAASKPEDKMVGPPENKSPEDHTVVELREMAKEKDISGYSGMNKAELIEAVFG